jgi:pyruvate,water dikinase
MGSIVRRGAVIWPCDLVVFNGALAMFTSAPPSRSSPNLVVFFDQPEQGTVSRVGGKGSNLISLSAAGFPVPPGFVVAAEAYQLFLEGINGLEAELASFDYEHPEVLREQCDRLRERLSRALLPAAVRDAVAGALERLGRASEDAFAVRSSSTFEDLAQAAFAGQHDTYLNVRGLDVLCEKIRDCFVSLWGDRAVLYRHHQGFSQHEARMAVVVQRQIACDVAGVGFSINPVSGRFDRLVIDANYGLGESVVGGEYAVDHFVLDKETREVVEQTIAHKERMLVATPTGVEERHVSCRIAERPCLKEDQLRAIAELLLRVEAHYGWPQDIEWGFKDDTLYQFQSRPVTTIEPHWTRDESAERFPNPMTPFTWDCIGVLFEGALAHSLEILGFPPLAGEWFGLFDHHVYGNQNLVQVIAGYRPLRARSLPELIAEVPDLRRRYAWVTELPLIWARDLDRYLVRLGKLSAVPVEGQGLEESWQHLRSLLAVAGEYIRPNIAITVTGAFLHRHLHGLVRMAVGEERCLAVVDGLLAGCETKTSLVNRELHELARLLDHTPAVRNELLERGGRSFWEQGKMNGAPEFAGRFERFLEDHGHREMDMDFYHPTWSGQPWVVLDAVALILRGGASEDPAETARRLRQRYFETEHQFLGGLPEEVRFFFRELIRLARTYTALDDLEHYQTTRLHPVARRAVLAIGRRLQERGVLDAAEDVFFCRKADLEELATAFSAEKGEACRRKVYEAKQSYESNKGRTPAWILEEGEAASAVEGNAVWRGLPGSSGVVTGPCFLVQIPEDFARFPRGAILVARTTNPAWTPLFYSARGLITESGGPLSHGAVTAREMRLPAVMSVRGAMTLFRDGQIVTVDGTRGIVTPGANV